MEKYKLKAVHFGESDVIATSSKDPIPSSVTTIWLSTESINNFNNMYDNDANLLPSSGFAYTPFGGFLYNNNYYPAQNGQNDTPDSGLYTVASGSTADYNKVLSWLKSKQ